MSESLTIPKKPARVVARELAELLGANERTIEKYIGVKRRGYSSSLEYMNNLARERGYSSQSDRALARSGLSSHTEQSDKRAKKLGWPSFNAYNKWRKAQKNPILSEGRQLKEKLQFEMDIEILAELPEITTPDPTIRIEFEDSIRKAMRRLNEREVSVIEGRSKGETYATIGKGLSLTRQKVEQIYNGAMEKIWPELFPEIPYKPQKQQERITDQELLFVYLMAKPIPKGKNRIEEVARLYEEAFNKIVNPKRIHQMLSNKNYKARTQEIRKKVFARETAEEK